MTNTPEMTSRINENLRHGVEGLSKLLRSLSRLISTVYCISLLSVPGKIYGRILNERMMKITDISVSDEQGGFQRGKG